MGQSFYNALIDILVMLYRRSNRIRCAPLAHSIWRGIASLHLFRSYFKKSKFNFKKGKLNFETFFPQKMDEARIL